MFSTILASIAAFTAAVGELGTECWSEVDAVSVSSMSMASASSAVGGSTYSSPQASSSKSESILEKVEDFERFLFLLVLFREVRSW